MKTVFDLSNWDYNNKSINSLCSCMRNVEEEPENANLQKQILLKLKSKISTKIAILLLYVYTSGM